MAVLRSLSGWVVECTLWTVGFGAIALALVLNAPVEAFRYAGF